MVPLKLVVNELVNIKYDDEVLFDVCRHRQTLSTSMMSANKIKQNLVSEVVKRVLAITLLKIHN